MRVWSFDLLTQVGGPARGQSCLHWEKNSLGNQDPGYAKRDLG